jgi:uncharacterized protein (TIGR00297 family)
VKTDTVRGFSETRRQVVHMAMASFALLLPYLAWWQAALCAVAAFLFNLLLLPRIGGSSLYRPVDAARGYPLGILFYPLSVLLLILAFPTRPDVVGAAWGIMAIGDGAATIVGRRIGGRRIAWNAEKTMAGTAAFALAGGAAGVALAAWSRAAVVPAPPPLLFTLAAPLAAAVAAALVETIPVRLDDNISVPIAAGIVLGGLCLIDGASVAAAWTWLPRSLALALAVNVPAAWMGWKAGTVSTAGAVTGALVGIVVLACAGLQGWALLFASYFVASVSSRLGLKRKAVLGIAEERGGRRGPGNTIANTGLAAFAAAVAAFSPYRETAWLVMVTALAAGASDTVASEIGKAWGRRTFLFPSLKPVRPGTSGAVSLEGTAAGLVAALGLSAVALALGLIEGRGLWYATGGATIGAFVESGLGATLEPAGILDNDMLNFVNTAVAAAAAVALAGTW